MNYELINSAIPTEYKQLDIVELILTNRGIPLNEVSHYLNTQDSDLLDPLLLDNMEEGLKLLTKHIKNNSKVTVIVDADLDGYASAATLTNYLHSLFPSFVENNFSFAFHENKSHGIIMEAIDSETRLVLVPDAGSSDVDKVAELAARGIDVLILDHHNSDSVPKEAVVINPMLCAYPTKALCGGGVVYKFCSYMDSIIGANNADNYLDLVALAEIGDVMDLRPFEVRHIITRGLANIRSPFIKTMHQKNEYSIGADITPMGAAFYIVPFVNAITRTGTMEEKELIFNSMLEWRAYDEVPSTKRGCKGQFESVVEQACRVATNVKARQKKQRDASTKLVEELIAENNLLDNKLLIIILENPDFSSALNGLIATELADRYKHPTMVLRNTTTENGESAWGGSCRGLNDSDFSDFRKFLEESGLVEFAQGHANAFGTLVLDSNLDKLIDYSNDKLKNYNFAPVYKVDMIWDFNNTNPNEILEIAKLKKLWGQGIQEPLIVIEHIPITTSNVTLMARDRNPTLKITLDGFSAIKFKSGDEEYNHLIPASAYELKYITIVAKAERNEWNGRVTPQLIITDYMIEENSMRYNF